MTDGVQFIFPDDDAKALPVDFENESVGDFIGRVATAQLDAKDTGEVQSIEANDKIIQHFNRKGLNGAQYFIYQGIKIYPLGKTEEIEEAEAISADEKMHGTSGGVVEQTR